MARKIETLAKTPLFYALSEGDIGKLDTQCVWRRACAGERLLDYDDDGIDLYFVVTGKVRVQIQTISGLPDGPKCMELERESHRSTNSC